MRGLPDADLKQSQSPRVGVCARKTQHTSSPRGPPTDSKMNYLLIYLPHNKKPVCCKTTEGKRKIASVLIGRNSIINVFS